jgi:hypothetical protein
VSGYTKNSQNSALKNNPIRKWAKDVKHFLKDSKQMKNTHLPVCLTPLAIGGMQIKTTMKYHND